MVNIRVAAAALALSLMGARGAQASALSDWTVAEPTLALGDWTATLTVNVSGAAYASDQGGGKNLAGLQAFAVLAPRLERTLPNGWQIGLKGSVLAYHDHLSGDNYGNDIVEKIYGYVQTPYGRFEMGQNDGAAYSQSVTAPVVDSPVAINDANVTFFKDPASGAAIIGIFNLRTGVFASANDAKFTYVSPRLEGVQLSGSYTPYQTKGPLPFANRGHHVPDRGSNMLEGNINYAAQWGDLSLQADTALALAHDAARSAGHDNVWDWGAGLESEYSWDDTKLSLGAAWRASNAYTFDIQRAFRRGTTSNYDLGATLTQGAWIAGAEYESGTADKELGLAGIRERGWQPSIAYVMNANLQWTLGYQHLHFREGIGAFYNGKPRVGMNATYLHANFQI